MISLTAVWMNDATNPSDLVQLVATAIGDSPAITGSVNSYANGRQRVVTSAAKPRQLSLTLTLVNEATVAWLEAHRGQTVVVRDPFGLRRYASFLAFDRTQYAYTSLSDISVKLGEITVDDAV